MTTAMTFALYINEVSSNNEIIYVPLVLVAIAQKKMDLKSKISQFLRSKLKSSGEWPL